MSAVFILGTLAVSIWTAVCNGVIRHIIGTITWPPATGAGGVNVLLTNISYLVPISEFTLALPISCTKLSPLYGMLTTPPLTLSMIQYLLNNHWSHRNIIHVRVFLRSSCVYKCFPDDDAQCCDWHVWSFITLIIVLQSLNNPPRPLVPHGAMLGMTLHGAGPAALAPSLQSQEWAYTGLGQVITSQTWQQFSTIA